MLDGFPRSGAQVKTLDAMLERLGVKLSAAVLLRLSEADARQRLANRLICETCKGSTTVLFANDGGQCPVADCTGTLTHRPDDRAPTTVDNRLAEFRELTMPVVAEYRASGRLIEIDVSGGTLPASGELRAAVAALGRS